MVLDLVLDIGNALIKGGVFDGKTLVDVFSLEAYPVSQDKLLHFLSNKGIQNALIASVNSKAEEAVKAALDQQKNKYVFLDYTKLKLKFDVDEPEQLGHDRIAASYGALSRFPTNDCIVVDIGTAITADFIAKEGRYAGGMIFLGPNLCAKALAEYTDKLPLVAFKKPPSPLAKTTETHLQGGIYYGQLGAIERLIDELRLTSESPSSVKIIATGGATKADSATDFIEDLKELVDLIDPHLVLIGLHEILQELTKE